MNPPNHFWIAFGSQENCATAFRLGIWGLRTTQESKWQAISVGDFVFLFAGRPVGGVVSCGVVLRKFKENKPAWPQERQERKAIWPLRFEFDLKFRIDPSFWRKQRLHVDELKHFRVGGFQVLPIEIAQKLLSMFPATATTEEPSAQRLQIKTPRRDSPHENGKIWLAEIGSMQGFIADLEYRLMTKRLDVVWRRLELSVPSHVFEVQVGGNLTEAMGKLKQAHELWNSKILLVGEDEHRSAFEQLAGGAFREIRDRAKFVHLAQVEDLYHRKRSYRDLETQLGILG